MSNKISGNLSESLETNYRIKKGIPWQTQEERVIILSPSDRMAHELDEVGSFVWKKINEKLNSRELLDRVCESFDVDSTTATNDISFFLKDLESKKLVEVV